MRSDSLEAALAALQGKRVVVVGDLMLDEYVWGDVARISPDAPVPVVAIRRRSHVLGGAGNVAHNVVLAGGAACLVSLTGADAAGHVLAGLLRETGIEAAGVLQDPARPTTVKTRVVARGQHVLRLDEEERAAPGPEVKARLLASFEALLPDCDVVLVSDYAKGMVDRAFFAGLLDRVARAGTGVPVVVDPKASDVSTYRGCTAITPNEHEAEIASGISVASDAGLEEAARRIGAAAGCGWVLVTRGERGMALSGPHGPLAHIPAEAREVYDVTGAGDTVLAYFGLGLAARLEPLQAATLANRAAGVAVGKVGTSPVDRAELLASFLGSGASASKFVDLRQAVARVEQQRSQGRRIVLTNGCFDLLHAGHVHLLERARALGDVLVVALNTDASVRRLKGEGRPVVGEWDRVRVLSALDAVSLVLLFDEDTPLEVIRRLRPDVLVKGGDYSVDTIVGADVVLAHGGRVETISLAPGRSTSALLSAIRQADEA